MYRQSLNALNQEAKTYMESIATHCPFTKPSHEAGLLNFSAYKVGKHAIEKVYLLAAIHTEILRIDRRKLPSNQGFLLCENLIIEFENLNQIKDFKTVFDWVHWILKCTYTTRKLVFGKFWKGEVAESRRGIPLPPPPVNLLSCRTLLDPNDLRFFDKTPEFYDAFKKATDSEDTTSLIDVIGVETCAAVEKLTDQLMQEGYFHKVLDEVVKIEYKLGKKHVTNQLLGNTALLGM
ncbi:MAG: DUF6875 domain-containing protein [Candidatus Paceibacterota bacterium]